MESPALIDVCVIGFGAIGALYAWALEKSGKARVTAVCRSNFDVVSGVGIEFHSDKLGSTGDKPWKPHRVVRTVEEASDRTYDYIICATKCVPEVTPTSRILSPLLTLASSPSSSQTATSTSVVLLQNGIGIEDDIFAFLSTLAHSGSNLEEGLRPKGRYEKVHVLSGCAWVDVTSIDGGRRMTQFGTERLVLGLHRPPSSNVEGKGDEEGERALRTLCEILREVGSTAEIAEDVRVARWRKVLWNASFSTICTLTRQDIGTVLSIPSARSELANIMQEVLSVAHAYLLSPTASPSAHLATLVSTILPQTVVTSIIEHENPKSTFKPSMLVDLESGRPIELEAIVGGVVRRAEEVGVEIPRLQMVYAMLSVVQKGLVEGRKH